MNHETRVNLSSQPPPHQARGSHPQSVIVELRDWANGGIRQVVELSLWEALQLRAQLNAIFRTEQI